MRHIVVSTLVALAACQPAPVEAPVPGTFPESADVIVTVDTVGIPTAVLDAVTADMSEEDKASFLASPQYTEFVDGLVTQQLLFDRAIEAGAHQSDKAAVLIALASREAVVRAHLEEIAGAGITDASVEQAYEERAVQYRRPSVRASHIAVREESLATDLMGQIEGGADFTALAAEHSIDPGTKMQGGDIGWFERERMLPEIAEAAFGAEVGDVVGPVESRMGFHLIKVTDRRESKPLEEVRGELEETLRQEILDEYVRTAKADAAIEYPSTGDEAPAGDEAPEGDAPAEGDAAPADDGHDHAEGDHGHDH